MNPFGPVVLPIVPNGNSPVVRLSGGRVVPRVPTPMFQFGLATGGLLVQYTPRRTASWYVPPAVPLAKNARSLVSLSAANSTPVGLTYRSLQVLRTVVGSGNWIR